MNHPTPTDLVRGPDGLLRPPWAEADDMQRNYYDTEWGKPTHGERELFERLSLEALQSGLSWATILRKRPALRRAFANFDPDTVAQFGPAQIEKLLANKEIIRHPGKIAAIIHNAQQVIKLRKHGGLDAFLWNFAPEYHQQPSTYAATPTQSAESRAMARELKKHGFRWVGPTTCYALMQATGMVNDRPQGATPLRGQVEA